MKIEHYLYADNDNNFVSDTGQNLYTNLALIYKEQGKLFQAVGDYSKAIQLNPRLHTVQYDLGQALRQLKMFEPARLPTVPTRSSLNRSPMVSPCGWPCCICCSGPGSTWLTRQSAYGHDPQKQS